MQKSTLSLGMTEKKFTKIIDPMKSTKSGIQVFKYSSIQIFKYSSIQVFKYSSIHVFNYSSTQVFKYRIYKLGTHYYYYYYLQCKD